MAGSSCVSSSSSSIFVPIALLKAPTAGRAKLSCSTPMEAAGPVNGPIMAILIGPCGASVGAAVGCGAAVVAAPPPQAESTRAAMTGHPISGVNLGKRLNMVGPPPCQNQNRCVPGDRDLRLSACDHHLLSM